LPDSYKKSNPAAAADLKSAPSPARALRGVVVTVVVVMVMTGGKCGRAGEHHQKQN
jgi:hypothetical protein